MRCALCNRPLGRAAATLQVNQSAEHPDRVGPVGPTCARLAGLVKPSLFDRRRKATKRGRRVDARQVDWVVA